MVPKGVYAPLITPYKADQSVDIETFKKHVQYVAGSGGEYSGLLSVRREIAY